MEIETAIENYILPFRLFIGLAFIVLLVFFFLSIAHTMLSQPVVRAQNASCRVVSIGLDPTNANDATAKLSCDGSKEIEETRKTGFIVSYLQNPRPFSCTLYKEGSADCTFKK